MCVRKYPFSSGKMPVILKKTHWRCRRCKERVNSDLEQDLYNCGRLSGQCRLPLVAALLLWCHCVTAAKGQKGLLWLDIATRREGSYFLCPSLSFFYLLAPLSHQNLMTKHKWKAPLQLAELHRLIPSSWWQIIAPVLSACYHWQSRDEEYAVISVRSKSEELKDLVQIRLTPLLGWSG